MFWEEKIREFFMPVNFNKGDFILLTGKVEHFLYYIECGIVRYFYYDAPKDKEITVDFAFSEQFCLSYASFVKQTSSVIQMQALTDIKAYKIGRSQLEQLMNNIEFVQIKANILEKLFLEKSERELRLLTQTPEENYLFLLQKEPVLMQNVPLKYIASYIGITPQALSRIRKRIVL